MTLFRSLSIIVLAIGAGAAFTGISFAANESPANDGDAILAYVNGAAIRVSDVDAELQRISGVGLDGLDDERRDELRASMQPQVLEVLVDDALLRAVVADNVDAVSDADVDDAFAALTAGMPDGVSLEESLDTFGMTEADLRDGIRQNLAMERLIAEQLQGVDAPDAEAVRGFYDANTELFGTAPFEEVEPFIGERLLAQAQESALRSYVDGLRADATIEYADDATTGCRTTEESNPDCCDTESNLAS